METYREYAPAAVLRDYVECYWSGEDTALPVVHRVLPDGCIDILFDFALEGIGASVIGAMTRPLVFESQRPEKMIAVRFRPGAAFAFFDLPMNELTNERVEIRNFWKDAEGFEASVIEHASVADHIRALEQGLVARLASARMLDQRINHAITLLKRRSGATSVDTLSSELGISRQHLTRKFQEYVGVNPKFFSRIVRMQDLLRRVRKVDVVDWCMLALDSGYYDQAHMIDDFRDLCGVSPARYLASI